MLPASDEAAVHEQALLPLTQSTAVRGKQIDLVVLRREVGDKRHRGLAVTAVDMAQHDCLVKGLSCCNLTVMAAQVQVLASHSDVALPLLRPLVLTHAMVARGLGLKTLLLSSAFHAYACGEDASVVLHASHDTHKHLSKGAMYIQEGNMKLDHRESLALDAVLTVCQLEHSVSWHCLMSASCCKHHSHLQDLPWIRASLP